MAKIEIPETWRKQVCAILATEETGKLILWTRDAEQRYAATPGAPWHFEVYQPLIEFLSQGTPTGCLVSMADPPGETYEFFFMFKGLKLYGKILLSSSRKSVVLFSAHLPLKQKLSCE